MESKELKKIFIRRKEQDFNWVEACIRSASDPKDVVYFLQNEKEFDGMENWIGIYSLKGVKIGKHTNGWNLDNFEILDEMASMIMEASIRKDEC